MNSATFKTMQPGDRVKPRSDVWATVRRVYYDDYTRTWFATVHFEDDPVEKTYTVMPENVEEYEPMEEEVGP